MSNTPTANLNIAYLDFDLIKASIRDYLRSQTQFSDYNFEGAGMSVLLDILAYNTHFFGFYWSMIANEMFLDSANLRSSVVSLAKMIGYTPRSTTSARATIGLVVTPNDSNVSAVIQKYTPFNTKVNNNTFSFITDRAYGATLQNGVFTFPEVTLVEGRPYTYRITVNSQVPNQRFVIPNSTVDTSTLTVRVQNSLIDTTTTTFVLADNLLEITAKTNCYFLQEVENQQYQLIFGDGIIGTQVIDGNIVMVDYMVSNGTLANGATFFTQGTPVSGYPSNLVNLTTLIPAAGGLDPETTDEIKFSAPKNYEAQGRAVTTSDYVLHVTQEYTNADSVAVWGGEDSIPPQYGKVFVSIKPVDGFVITETAKELVTGIIKSCNIVSVLPDIIDPDYTFIIVTTSVKYNPANTTRTTGDIQLAAYNAILNFATLNLDKFGLELHYSQLLTAIDSSEPSIISNLTTLQMKKLLTPQLDVIQNYTMNFHNAIVPGSLTSSSFITVHDPLLTKPYINGKNYTLADDGSGTIQIYEHGIGISDAVVRSCGTVDYANGIVYLTQFMPFQGDANGQIAVIVRPQLNDVIPVQNNILFINPTDVNVLALVSTM